MWAAVAHAAEGPFYIHRGDVNLRSEPNGEILLVFDVNDKVFVVKKDGNWSYVSAPGREAKGWVWTDYYGKGRVNEAIQVVSAQPEDAGNQVEALQAQNSYTVEADPAHVSDAVLEGGSSLAVTSFVPAEPEQVETTTLTEPLPSISIEQSSAKAPDELPFLAPSQDAANGKPAESPARVAVASEPPSASTGDAVQVGFYQPFEAKEMVITTPAMLGSEYVPVGGNDIALIQGTKVNVRADSSTNSKIVGSVNQGDKCYLISQDEQWCYVSIPQQNLKGWVHGDYVNELPRVEIKGSNVRMREQPSLDSRIKVELSQGEVFYRFGASNGWVELASSASGLRGWVHGDYIKVTTKEASRPYVVTGDGVNFRSSPEVDARIITALDRGTKLQVLGRNDRWSFVSYNGQQGWMYSQYLDPAFSNAPRQVYGKSIGGRLISRAREMEGTPYVWGGESDNGVDCSGLIYKLLLDEGASSNNLPRRASTQMAELGQAIDKEDMQPGDLVFFTTYKPGPSHVGIYLGDGDFIHASSARGKVTINSMSDGYYKKRFVGARRITESELVSLK